MRWLRATLLVVLVLYVALWVLAFNGAPGLRELLLVPLILAVLVALGVALQRFMGITPRRQRFQDREDDTTP